jgi:DNA invertase Pin-like site-specific DNA recombinase
MIFTKVGYARVSKTEQNADNQKRLLLAEGVPEDCIFVDIGVSGTVPARKRPGFKMLLKFIEDNPGVQYLYIFEISRLGRTMYETVELIHEIELSGPIVWSLTPGESFMRIEDKALRQLLISVMSYVAQIERDNLIQRTHAGLDRARAEGKKLGPKRKHIDWVKVEDWWASGLTWVEVAKRLKITPMQLHRRRRQAGYLK